MLYEHTHQNFSLILAALSWDPSLPSFHPIFSLLFVTMELLLFTFHFTVKGYNVYITIELFPHIDVMMAESTMNSPDRDMQGPLGVNTFLNLFNH